MALRDWLWVSFLGVIWGFSFLFNAVLLREMGPFWVSALRVSIAALGCWAYFLVTVRTLPRTPGPYLGALFIGVFGFAIPFALFPISQGHMASGLAAIVNAMTPIMTVIVSQVWPGGEKATLNKSLGVLAGFAGCTLLALPALSQGGSSELWAIAGCLLATLLYAITLNVARRLAGVDPTTLATLILTGAACFALPLAISTENPPAMRHLETWIAVLGLGLVGSCFAVILMYRLLPRIGATNMSITTFIAPLSAVALGVGVLHETLRLEHILGLVGILVGLLLIDGRIIDRMGKARLWRGGYPPWF